MSHPLTNEPLLELIFAIVLPAIGSAILFNIGASSGGTDVIAMILKKYTSVDIGKGLLASDILFTIAGFFVFDIKTGLYSLLGLTMRSTLIDSLIETAKENDLDLYRYLVWLLHNAPGLSRTDEAWAESFLPVNAPQKCKIPKP